ncbi:MAG: DUF420 domain-containing protein [Pirellulales bacterium]|nr:DUF420 domain-containing protein [Pirellulales bacterium]
MNRFRAGCALAVIVACFAATSLAQDEGDGRPAFPQTELQDLVVTPFTLTDSSGQPFDSQSLAGKVWIASFFYSTCPGPCLKLNQAIERLLRDLEDVDVTFVSITVDPATDTPEQLAKYRQNFRAPPDRWRFLTGAEAEIVRVAYEIFRVPADKAAHSEKLILVDPRGKIQGYYHALTDAKVVALKSHVKKLLAGEDDALPLAGDVDTSAGTDRHAPFDWRRLPALNAALNATSGVLLVVGLLLIKAGRERAHRNMMLTAFAVSVVFLASYLTYHQMLKNHTGLHGVPFKGPSPVREAYYALLISHVLLAAAVPVLALRTIYLGLKDRRDAHRRWARWTMPIWLYVSVTGVVIYLMLYHVYPG